MIKLSKQILMQNGTFLRRLAYSPAILVKRQNSNSSYDGDGKTNVKVLNNDMEMGLMVNSFSQIGFTLNNKFNVIGPMVIFPRTVLSWNVNDIDDINENSLRLLLALEPKLELLIIGTGDMEVTPEFYHQMLDIVKPFGIRLEVLKTEPACTTFNFMNAESRFVAAAMIPPKKIAFNDMDLLAAIERRKQLYGPDDIQIENTESKKITS